MGVLDHEIISTKISRSTVLCSGTLRAHYSICKMASVLLFTYHYSSNLLCGRSSSSDGWDHTQRGQSRDVPWSVGNNL